MFTNLSLPDVLTFAMIYGGVVVAAAWLAMVIWAYRDMRARTRDTWAQVLVAAVVFVLNFPGLIIYLLLRPRETLAEAYERSLEEEALLQEIEEKPSCPGCGQRVPEAWQACPHCHTRLKKPCINCGEMLHLSWNLCPYCAVPQTTGARDSRNHVSRTVRGRQPAQPETRWEAPTNAEVPPQQAPTDALEFLDEDY